MSASRVSRKRARTASEHLEDDQPQNVDDGEIKGKLAGDEPQDVEVESLPLIRDADFWLDDGTVILVAGNVEFRVYGGILAHHSPVLKGLFSRPETTRLLTFNGHDQSAMSCPVVHLSDSPEDIRELLRAYMPRDAASMYHPEVPSFDAVSASIRLGHKYEIVSLYDQSLEFLRRHFPSNFDDFGQFDQWVPAGWDMEEAIGVVNLASLIGEHLLLPVALLVCTTLGDHIVRGYERANGTQEHLTIDDQALVIKARMEIRKARVAALFSTLCPSPAKTCKTVSDCRSALRKAVYSLHSTIDDWLGDKDDPFNTYQEYIKGRKLELCHVCEVMVNARADAESQKLWNRLPLLLGIQVPGWPGGAPAPPEETGPAQRIR
ncbi:hypothetical protein L226DRAFT_489948 [Lentinus tigrinus ALCF2SS1-7]|uniref:BTB domain-containing protein n=1 Tax=Lentinus tigrinus ALCF2SS1-6 TaxID=1328759 RepID=A0A5C2S4N2_9APHY|nr:hypothetical protein L227DRAFT_505012 [Lentinus tigrinus ALCF2SS1-6]RPD72831.1 hypothetical protein L226DRAFT_489948 [Lentinus tigrinus ALCF2SS1-7]